MKIKTYESYTDSEFDAFRDFGMVEPRYAKIKELTNDDGKTKIVFNLMKRLEKELGDEFSLSLSEYQYKAPFVRMMIEAKTTDFYVDIKTDGKDLELYFKNSHTFLRRLFRYDFQKYHLDEEDDRLIYDLVDLCNACNKFIKTTEGNVWLEE